MAYDLFSALSGYDGTTASPEPDDQDALRRALEDLAFQAQSPKVIPEPSVPTGKALTRAKVVAGLSDLFSSISQANQKNPRRRPTAEPGALEALRHRIELAQAVRGENVRRQSAADTQSSRERARYELGKLDVGASKKEAAQTRKDEAEAARRFRMEQTAEALGINVTADMTDSELHQSIAEKTAGAVAEQRAHAARAQAMESERIGLERSRTGVEVARASADKPDQTAIRREKESQDTRTQDVAAKIADYDETKMQKDMAEWGSTEKIKAWWLRFIKGKLLDQEHSAQALTLYNEMIQPMLDEAEKKRQSQAAGSGGGMMDMLRRLIPAAPTMTRQGL